MFMGLQVSAVMARAARINIRLSIPLEMYQLQAGAGVQSAECKLSIIQIKLRC